MKYIGIMIFLLFTLVLSCGTAPEPQGPDIPQNPQETTAAAPEEKTFNPQTISEERRASTKAEVQALIEDLNRIIRAKNYNQWKDHLADSYVKEINSQEFLEEKTEELYTRDQAVAQNTGRDPRLVQKKNLRTDRDYFDNIVVPSRQNDHVDDIDFITETWVKAWTMNSKGEKVVLYNLELIDNKWKIVN